MLDPPPSQFDVYFVRRELTSQHEQRCEFTSSALFAGAIGVMGAIGPAEGGLSASTAHGFASFHVSTSRRTTTPASESGARCTNLAGIVRAGKRMDPKLADLSDLSERRSFTSGGALGRA